VVVNVRWYLTYKRSQRDLVAMRGERGIDLAHSTSLRWVQHYTRNSRNAGKAGWVNCADAGNWQAALVA
jgi:transposase-like protein